MNDAKLGPVAVLVMGLVAGALVGASCSRGGATSDTATGESADTGQNMPSTPATEFRWLTGSTDEKLLQIERHLRGLDVAMAEIGYRYGELIDAARSRNWEHAKYQTEKIGLSLQLALERRPKRVKSAQPFLSEALPTVLVAIDGRDGDGLDRAMDGLHNACVECHKSEKVLYFKDSVERIRARAGGP